MPDLPALFDPTMEGASLGGGPGAGPYYSFSDGSGNRIRSDFNRVRSDLYTQNRLVAFQDWAHAYNMKLRLQQEDGPITSIGDELQTSSVLDRSEYESLTGSDQTDLYRPMASANHMTGNTWYSTECCAVLNESYAATVQDAIIRMNHEFAGGVNRPVYHIRPYIDSPASSWPGLGFSTAKVTFANAWNRTEPYWGDEAATNDYFARNHEVLTQGAAKTDIAVYQRNYSSPAAFCDVRPEQPPLAGPRPAARRIHVGLPRRVADEPAERRGVEPPPRRGRPGLQGADLRPVPVPDVEHRPGRAERRGRPEDPRLRPGGPAGDLRRRAHGHGRHAGLR